MHPTSTRGTTSGAALAPDAGIPPAHVVAPRRRRPDRSSRVPTVSTVRVDSCCMRGCARSSQMTATTAVSAGKRERRLLQAAERHPRADHDEGDRQAVAGLRGEAAHLGDGHRVLEPVDAAEGVEHRPRRCRGQVADRPQPAAHHAGDLGAGDDGDVARVAHRRRPSDAAQPTASSNSSASAYSRLGDGEDDGHARSARLLVLADHEPPGLRRRLPVDLPAGVARRCTRGSRGTTCRSRPVAWSDCPRGRG